MEQLSSVHRAKPLWRKVVDFPLVAMLIASAIFLLAAALGLALGKLVPPMGRNWTAIVHAVITIAVVLAAYKFLITRLGNCPRDDLPQENAGKHLALGLLAGLLIFSLVVGVAALFGVYRIVGPGDSSRLVIEIAGTAILPGFMEELFFRGILFRWTEEFAGSFAALALTSALFGLAHIMNPNASWFASFAIAVEAGILLGGAYMLTRTLWFPMGLHAAWNFTQGELFDIPVSGLDEHGLVEAKLSGPALLSGGQFGLEASLLALIIATLAGLAILWLAINRGELVKPSWVRRRAAQRNE